MTIEERLLKAYGKTDNPMLAVWLLRDGTLINGSYSGQVRERDHSEINEFYKPSVRQKDGSSFIYIQKFMRRGNIRVGCSDVAGVMQYAVTPSESQMKVLCATMEWYLKQGKETVIEHLGDGSKTQFWTYPKAIAHLYKKTKAAIPRQFIHYAFDTSWA